MSTQHAFFNTPPALGFVDAVQDSQKTFRAALQAMAYPGRIQHITSECEVPSGVSLGMAALLLTLVDVDTPVWLPEGADEQIRHYLRFHCGCSFVNDPVFARFVVVPTGFDMPSLSLCHQGDPAFPDTSSTLLLEVQALDNDANEQAVVLTGPGIQTEQLLSISGLPSDFMAQWKVNQHLFPLGVDIFLIQENRICGLPRTVRMEC